MSLEDPNFLHIETNPNYSLQMLTNTSNDTCANENKTKPNTSL